MSNVIAFTPRARAPLPPVLPPLAGIDLRAHLEEAAQTALDAADKIIAALDHIEAADDEADPRLTAMAAHVGPVVQLHEAPAPVAAEPEPEPDIPPYEAEPEPETPTVVPEQVAEPEPASEPIRLPWRGAGNVVSAAGCALLSLVAGAA